MIRTRLLWFTIGFASASAATGQFIFRDLWADRQNLSFHVMEKFAALDARVKNLEGVFSTSSDPDAKMDEANLKVNPIQKLKQAIDGFG